MDVSSEPDGPDDVPTSVVAAALARAAGTPLGEVPTVPGSQWADGRDPEDEGHWDLFS